MSIKRKSQLNLEVLGDRVCPSSTPMSPVELSSPPVAECAQVRTVDATLLAAPQPNVLAAGTYGRSVYQLSLDSPSADDNSHGTHVAGTVAAVTNSAVAQHEVGHLLGFHHEHTRP